MKKIVALSKWMAILALVVIVLGVIACNSNSSSTTTATSTVPNIGLTTKPGSTGTPGGSNVTLNISAKNMAFDTNTLTVQAGASVTINFTNNDSVPHNIAFYNDSTAAKSIFVGEVISGVKTVTYKFTGPTAPGTYFFRCDIHPSIMTGDFVVTPITQ